jgi:LPS sulfotransferase NodH
LLTLAVEHGFPVLHCLRRNLLAQAVSEALALATDVWHAPGPAGVAPARQPPVVVDADFVLRRMRSCIADMELFRKWLPSSLVSEIWYEDLFGLEGGDPFNAVEVLKRRFPDWPGDQAAPLNRLGRDARSWIANIGDLRDRLLATEFAVFAESL